MTGNANPAALPAMSPVTEGVRAYFAPVNRTTGATLPFDSATQGRFSLDAPPDGWMDVGWISDLSRQTETKIEPLRSGLPALARSQVRRQMGAEVRWSFQRWGKLQMAINSGAQHMNLLADIDETVALGSGSTAQVLQTASVTTLAKGDVVVVDVDYTGETGFVGSGVDAAYIKSPEDVAYDANYVRRVSYNVGLIVAVDENTITLAKPLPAGIPTDTMKLCRLVGFEDREGGSFFQEWSALFVLDGVQGDRVIFHYPRLQSAGAASETREEVRGPFAAWQLPTQMRALPVTDGTDGEQVFCFRSYLPATMREVG